MNIQMKEVLKLRAMWAAKGNPVCTHPDKLCREYYLGAHTGDYVCPICGECFAPDQVEQDSKTFQIRPKSL
jgi:hypothetical protein